MKRKKLVLLIIALLGAVATATLGMWQLGRATQKENLMARLQQRSSQAALTNADISTLAATKSAEALLMDRSAEVRGQWLHDYTLFLDNRQMDNRQGLLVITPLRLAMPTAETGTATVLLVQRGWVPRNFLDRSALPNVQLVNGDVTVRGRMAASPSKLFEFKGEDIGKIRQNVTIDSLAKQTGLPLAPMSLVQLEPALEGKDDPQLLRHWPPINTGVEKHYGYAFQWFLICALIIGLTVWFAIVRPRRLKAPYDPHHPKF